MKAHFYINNYDKYFLSKKKNKILSGKWCFINKNKTQQKNKNFKIVDDVWKNYRSYNKDYKLCKYLLNYLTLNIGTFLNKINNTKKPKEYWKIVLTPWLSRYIPIYLFRWRTVESAFKEYDELSIFKLNIEKNFIPFNTRDFVELARNNDKFNYQIYLKILKYFNKQKSYKIKFIKKKKKIKKIITQNLKKNIFKEIIYDSFVKINNYFTYNNSIYFESALLKKKYYLNLCYKLKLVPNFFFNRDLKQEAYTKIRCNLNLREEYKNFQNTKISSVFYKDKRFINFIINNIQNDIPKCFVEGFEDLLKEANQIKLNPKLIFTGFNYIYNEIFKVWVAESKLKNNSKLFICSHGGGSIYKNDVDLFYQSKLATKFLIYAKPRNKKEIQLSPLKLIGIKKKLTKNKILSYVASPNFKYPSNILKNRFSELENYKNILNFKKYLNLVIFNQLIYLPSRYFLNFEIGKIKKILKKKYINRNSQFNVFAKKSNLIVCSYPETTFLESIYLRPTILICNKDYIDQTNINSKLSKELQKNRVLFYNSVEASKHINNIWLNTDEWWNEKKIYKTIEEFKSYFCNINDNSLNDWVKFVKSQKNLFNGNFEKNN